jgi:hypothetical protein
MVVKCDEFWSDYISLHPQNTAIFTVTAVRTSNRTNCPNDDTLETCKGTGITNFSWQLSQKEIKSTVLWDVTPCSLLLVCRITQLHIPADCNTIPTTTRTSKHTWWQSVYKRFWTLQMKVRYVAVCRGIKHVSNDEEFRTLASSIKHVERNLWLSMVKKDGYELSLYVWFCGMRLLYRRLGGP